jgi:hypothetical protein
MADIAEITTVVKNTGVLHALGGAAAADTIPTCTGKELLLVTNGSGSSINVTISSHENCDQGSDHDLVIAVLNGTTRILGPFLPATRFANPSTGKIDVAWSATATITRAVIKNV